MVEEIGGQESMEQALKEAANRRGQRFDRLFGIHPSLNKPYVEPNRELVHSIATAELEAMRLAEKLMTAGEKIAPEHGKQLAICERACEVIEGKSPGV